MIRVRNQSVLMTNIKQTYSMSDSKKAQRITVSLSEPDHSTLLGLSKQYDVSLSWLVRQAVADFIEKHRAGQLQLPLSLTAGRTKSKDEG